jgi:N-acetylglutamate synthase-like GNAT family acetyltransferase
MIRADPKIDVLALIAAEATWTTRDPRLGLCAFRRTWSNSIVVDYIAVHPMLLQTDSEVSGIGTAMLYATANIAKKIGAERVWLETTDSSVGYYQYLFAEAVDKDLLVISTEDFYNRIHEYFQK